jgi:hypothetical protein
MKMHFFTLFQRKFSMLSYFPLKPEKDIHQVAQEVYVTGNLYECYINKTIEYFVV